MLPVVPIVAGAVLLLSGCGKNKSPVEPKEPPQTSNDSLIKGTPQFIDEFYVYNPASMELADWANGVPFDNAWKPDHAAFNNYLTITLDNQSYLGKPYTSAECRTKDETYSFGYYEVRMKSAKCAGTVAGSFFIYMGAYGQPSHNEIDFEVLGGNTAQVQLNYFYAGTGTSGEHKKMINLPFDASQGFNNYGFIWDSTSIEWFVNGVSVYKATNDIPQGSCKIMMNLWPGDTTVARWLGTFTYPGTPLTAQYDWIKYDPLP